MELITFILGAIGGFVVHSLSMKVSFKQRTIDNKVKVYDAIIGHWVRMRNIIYSVHPDITGEPVPLGTERDFDRIYGESQQLIGEAILICEDKSLTEDINTLNEKLYRTRWDQFNLDEANKEIEIIKNEALEIIERMREDIKSNTILHWSDFVHIFSGLKKSA